MKEQTKNNQKVATTTTTTTTTTMTTSSITKYWVFLVFIRLAVNLFGQRGYIHPDEFFQGPEIIAGDVFDCRDRILRTWEFKMDYFAANESVKQGPIRNIAIPYIFYGLPMLLLKFLVSIGSIDFTSLASTDKDQCTCASCISVDSTTLIYYPRLFMAFSSLIVDLCLVKLANLCNVNASRVILVFASSYITIVFLTRTFSNTIETLLFAVFLYFVVKSIKAQVVQNEWIESLKAEIRTNKANEYRFDFVDQSISTYLGGKIGIVFCLGVFNRPTFLIYSFVPLSYWVLYDFEKCNSWWGSAKMCLKRVVSISKLIVPTALILILIDTAYFYEIRSLDELLVHIADRNLVLTPYNFFKYNSDAANLAEHGTHPAYQHLINIILLFGSAAPMLIVESIKSISYWARVAFSSTTNYDEYENGDQVNLETIASDLYTRFMNEKIRFLFILAALVPLVSFSFISHKEQRFLLPLIIPVSLRTSERLFGNGSGSLRRYSWFLFNLMGIFLFGYLHQGGVIPAVSYTQKMFTHVSNLDIDQHVIFYHTYMPPRYLIEAPLSANLIANNRYKYEMRKQEENLKSVHSSNNQQRDFSMPERKIYDLMSSGNRASLEELINSIKSRYVDPKTGFISKNFAIFLVAPEVLDLDLNRNRTCGDDVNSDDKTKTGLVFEVVTKFRFHVSFEHLEDHFNYINCQLERSFGDKFAKCYLDECEKKNLFQRVFDSFSLNFYQVLI